jgi:ABC-type transport system involved in multi-copper enzyme maturation permease subunit
MARKGGPSRSREVNPVLAKELRSRFRGPRAFAALTVFLLALAGTALLVYFVGVMTSRPDFYYDGTTAAGRIGWYIFMVIAVLEMVLIAFIGPALTMNSVSGEVERQTFDMLLATPLSAWSILRGKVGAALAYVAMLTMAAIPVMSLAFVFGGVTAKSVILVQITVLVAGLLFVSVGIFYSAVLKRTVRAAILSYLTVGLLSVGPLVFSLVPNGVLWMGPLQDGRSLAVLETSPLAPLLAVVVGSSPGTWDGAALFVAQSLLFQIVVAAALLVLAGWRIRRAGRETSAALLVLVVAFWAWFGWVAWNTPLP